MSASDYLGDLYLALLWFLVAMPVSVVVAGIIIGTSLRPGKSFAPKPNWPGARTER